MATPRVTIDDLPEQLTPAPTDLLVIQDSGTTKKMTFATLQALATGPAGPPGPEGPPGSGSGGELVEDPPGSGLYYEADSPGTIVLAGLPVGGTTNQVLAKATDDDYGSQWFDVVANSGGVAAIQVLTQAEYDALTPDPNTLYVITP